MNWKKMAAALAAVLLVLVSAGGVAFWLRPAHVALQLGYLQEPMKGFHSATVTVEGRPMHYLATGPEHGPVVVLVHGLGGSAEDWLHLAPYLAHAGYRVYMPDLFGYGRSPRPADFSYSVRDESAAVIGFLDAMQLQQVDLGGWSMGGWIAQLAAVAFPERIHRLLLFDSVGLYAPPQWNTDLFTPADEDQLRQLQLLLEPAPRHIPSLIARDILRISHERAWVIHRALDSMLTGRDTTDALLPTLRMPVLLVWGDLDRITPLSLGNRMHELIPGSELVVAPGCGHMAPRDCTAIVGPRVVEFLGR